MFKNIFYLVSCFFVLNSCAISTAYDYDKNVDFTQYKSYSIYQKGINDLKINDLDKRRIVAAIKGQLSAKGFTEDETGGDLVINVLASSKKVINVNNDPYWGFYGWNRSVYEDREGRLTVHLVDNKKNTLVWVGVADGLDVDNLTTKNDQINKAIQKIFSHFPPEIKK